MAEVDSTRGDLRNRGRDEGGERERERERWFVGRGMYASLLRSLLRKRLSKKQSMSIETGEGMHSLVH